MSYIGREPVTGNFVKLDSITVVNGQAAYTMNNGGSAFTAYDNVNQFLVSLNGVLQAPTDSFTVSGSTLTFASNLSTGDVIDFVIVLGDTLDIGTPSDNTVSTAKIVDDAVTSTKINNDIISGSTELASEPADTDEFLVSDAGTLKRIDYSLIKGGGKVLQVVQTAFTTDTATSNTSYTAVANFEVNITPSATSSKVLVNASFSIESTNSGTLAQYTLYRDDTTNLGNSTYGFGIATYGTSNGRNFASINYLDSPNTTSAVNYQIYQKVDNGGSCKVAGGSAVCTITAMEIGA